MKRISGEFPYDNYWLYIVFHRKENRRMAVLILKENRKIRTTISYARYLMAIKVKRFLLENEEVDHIDNDKTNDDITNLQILSKEENIKKQSLLRSQNNPPTMMEMICPVCYNKFNYPSRNYRYHTKNGRTRFNCSRKCAGVKI